MGAILPLRYPSYCVLRSAALAVLLSLPLAPTGAAPSPNGFALSLERSVALDEPVLALAWIDDARLAVLFADSVALYRIEAASLRRTAHHALDGPLSAVRRPGGRLVPGDDAFWALSSRMPHAVLYAIDGDRLEARAQATALPWPGAPEGLRYREGTDLLETRDGLLLVPPIAGLAVDPEGRVLVAGPDALVATTLRAGPAIAVLETGLVAAASAASPGTTDTIQVLRPEDGDVLADEAFPVSGAVRALAARAVGPDFRLVAAVELEHGGELRLLRLRRRPS
jgi:hypothetical protein